jgi:plasmid stability protein
MSWIFVCDRNGGCEAASRSGASSIPRINAARHGRGPEEAARDGAKEFLAANHRYRQVEMTVDEDSISV